MVQSHTYEPPRSLGQTTMSSASDKARFYLEQSVPELKEYEKHNLFTPVCAQSIPECMRQLLIQAQNEITSIARKRSDFEHKINAKGSRPSDYVRYAEYEVNLDSLRRKRAKRLGVKSSAITTTRSGPRRIHFIYDRGTRKFPGDLDLWIQSIEYARSQMSYKKLSQILTDVLRLRPTKPQLWIWAAKTAVEDQGDMTTARSYLQRGLRFCKTSRVLWLEFARLELAYIAKISARRRVLGIDVGAEDLVRDPVQEDHNADVLALPQLTAQDLEPEPQRRHEIDEATLRTLESTPVLQGAIPMRIFDAAINQFDNDLDFALTFFDLVSTFDQIPCLQEILHHIIHQIRHAKPDAWQTLFCWIRLPVIGTPMMSSEYPRALGESLSRIRSASAELAETGLLVEGLAVWIKRLLAHEDLDPALEVVLKAQYEALPRM